MENSQAPLPTYYRSAESSDVNSSGPSDSTGTLAQRHASTARSTAGTVLMLGPDRSAVSGISTHLNLLFGSPLAGEFRLLHFQVGSEGRAEGLGQRLKRLLLAPFHLWRTIRTARPDIVHINSAMDAKAYWRDLSLTLAARLSGKRVVLQIHGGFLPGEFLPFGKRGRGFLKWSLGLPDVIVLLAECERRAYEALDPHLPVRVIPNAIELTQGCGRAVPKPADAGPLRLVYIGRLERAKGVYEAVSALAALHARGVPARLCLAGTGSEAAALAEHARRLGLESHVDFRGPTFGADKQALWGDSDVFVFPTYREGLPYALLEAMLARAVVVTTAVGAIPDVVTDRVHGLFVPPRDSAAIADAVEWIHRHRAEARELGTSARRRVEERYGVSRLAEDFRTLYRQI
jgi:glycosyltransferase involved in cell wall biosynthesis